MNSLTNNLKSLRQIKMDQRAKDLGRTLLLKQLLAQQSVGSLAVFKYFFTHPLVSKPLTYVAAIVLLMLAGSSYTFSATLNARPGNTFYPVKLQLEKFQVTMTADQMTKTKKQIEFTDRRWQEFQAVSELTVDNLDKPEQVARAARHFNESLRQMKNSLTEVSQQEKITDNGSFDIAKMVNDKTIEYEQKLAGEYIDLPISVKSVMAKEVEEIKFQSLEILVAKYEQGSAGISQVAFESQLQNKIIALVEKASAMEQAQQVLALKKLQIVQVALDEKKYSTTVSLIRSYEQWLVEYNAPKEETGGEVLGDEEVVEVDVKVERTNTSTEKIIE
jgi:hypothetical protein